MLAGLSIMYCLRIPPCFCATAVPVVAIMVKRTKTAVAKRHVDAISPSHSRVNRGARPVLLVRFCPRVGMVRYGTVRSVLDRHSPGSRSANMIVRLTGVPSQRNLIAITAWVVKSPDRPARGLALTAFSYRYVSRERARCPDRWQGFA